MTAPAAMTAAAAVDVPAVEIRFRRPPDRLHTYVQELLHDGDRLKITLWTVTREDAPVVLGRPEAREPEDPRAPGPPERPAAEVGPGGALLWFTFPGLPWEVAAAYDARGRRLGYYTNIIRPARFEGRLWHVTDLFLDVWQGPRRKRARLLDEDELERAVERGWIDPEDAEIAREAAAEILARARRGRWPPRPARRWTLDLVPSLRFRRDEPGSYAANLLSTRIIGFGLYTLGAASLTSIAFAIFTDAFLPGVTPADHAWLRTILLEAAALFPLSLAGLLPATRTPRPSEALTERALFLGALVMGIAVIALHDESMWREALVGIYSALGLFLVIFAAARAAFDRVFPGLAVAGIAVCILAVVLLL